MKNKLIILLSLFSFSTILYSSEKSKDLKYAEERTNIAVYAEFHLEYVKHIFEIQQYMADQLKVENFEYFVDPNDLMVLVIPSTSIETNHLNEVKLIWQKYSNISNKQFYAKDLQTTAEGNIVITLSDETIKNLKEFIGKFAIELYENNIISKENLIHLNTDFIPFINIGKLKDDYFKKRNKPNRLDAFLGKTLSKKLKKKFKISFTNFHND